MIRWDRRRSRSMRSFSIATRVRSESRPWRGAAADCPVADGRRGCVASGLHAVGDQLGIQGLVSVDCVQFEAITYKISDALRSRTRTCEEHGVELWQRLHGRCASARPHEGPQVLGPRALRHSGGSRGGPAFVGAPRGGDPDGWLGTGGLGADGRSR